MKIKIENYYEKELPSFATSAMIGLEVEAVEGKGVYLVKASLLITELEIAGKQYEADWWKSRIPFDAEFSFSKSDCKLLS